MNITCPHCGANNVSGAAFCESCGKALPSAAPTGPRVVSADMMPQSAAAAGLIGDELKKQQKSASNALLAVAILQTVFGAIVLIVLSSLNTRRGGQNVITPFVWAVQFAVAALFWGLWFWSRRSPLPATIVGLCLYVTLVAINVVSATSQLARDPQNEQTGMRGLGIGILDIVIIVVLARAINAGLKYKRLQQQGSST